VKGVVDDQLRALVRLSVAVSRDGERVEITAWIDTAFNGGLVLPRKLVAELGVVMASSAEAVLADGQIAELETFTCFFDWFGNAYETQVVASGSEFPLLGTLLLAGHRLEIDYQGKTVELT
jgi:clan AA aspartic protease